MTRKGEETQDQPDYLSYLLRLWRVTSAGQVAWRASLECPHSGDRLGFADLHGLWDFLQSQMRLQEENAQARSEEVGWPPLRERRA